MHHTAFDIGALIPYHKYITFLIEPAILLSLPCYTLAACIYCMFMLLCPDDLSHILHSQCLHDSHAPLTLVQPNVCHQPYGCMACTVCACMLFAPCRHVFACMPLPHCRTACAPLPFALCRTVCAPMPFALYCTVCAPVPFALYFTGCTPKLVALCDSGYAMPMFILLALPNMDGLLVHFSLAVLCVFLGPFCVCANINMLSACYVVYICGHLHACPVCCLGYYVPSHGMYIVANDALGHQLCLAYLCLCLAQGIHLHLWCTCLPEFAALPYWGWTTFNIIQG